jgi:hypothetical protein
LVNIGWKALGRSITLSGDEYSTFIRKGKLEDLERIADFNIQMVEETEVEILDRNTVRKGVKAVLKDESKGFYLIAEDNENGKTLTGQLMVTFE